MVGASAVVLDAPAELGEEQHHDVLVHVVLFHVIHEVADCAGHILPELGMAGQLGCVGVEAAMLRVIDARAEACGHHLRD